MPSSLREVFGTFSSAVITGGSSGLGQAFIELGHKMHPGLFFCNLSRTQPASFFPGNILRHIPCDLSRESEIEHAAGQVESWLRGTPAGRVLLINNSGFGAYGPFPKPNLARHLEMVDVNVRAVVHLTGALLPALRVRGGAVMTIASISGFQPTPYASTYGASKAFLIHWTLGLNEELRGSGVKASVVCPGPVKTRFFKTAGLAQAAGSPFLSMEPARVVELAMRGLSASRALVVPGLRNQVCAFAASKLPKALATRIGGAFLARYRGGKEELS